MVRRGAGHDEIVDVDSTSGTFVNDQLVRTHQPLSDGDVIRLGWVVLVYVEHGDM
jgi:pSer/pThr/pTyr-binding forkhead associated (FHA) protein